MGGGGGQNTGKNTLKISKNFFSFLQHEPAGIFYFLFLSFRRARKSLVGIRQPKNIASVPLPVTGLIFWAVRKISWTKIFIRGLCYRDVNCKDEFHNGNESLFSLHIRSMITGFLKYWSIRIWDTCDYAFFLICEPYGSGASLVWIGAYHKISWCIWIRGALPLTDVNMRCYQLFERHTRIQKLRECSPLGYGKSHVHHMVNSHWLLK